MSQMKITKLLWLDLEMTGLEPTKDLILEVAAIATDLDYNELAKYEAVIKHSQDVVPLLNEFSAIAHKENGLLERLETGEPEDKVASDLVDFIQANFTGQEVVLAGNSIHMDRQFIDFRWPEVAGLLHYRMLDVSSYKILAQAKHNLVYKKNEAHRALGDIQESISELRFYEEHYGGNK